MPLTTTGVRLRLVSFTPDTFIKTNPLKSRTFDLVVKNDEPEDVIVKIHFTDSDKFKSKPKQAYVSSRSSQEFRLTLRRLNLADGVQFNKFSIWVFGVRENDYTTAQILKDDVIWKQVVTTAVHYKYLYVIYSGMNRDNWWKSRDGTEPVSWGVDANVVEQEEDGDGEEGESAGSSESSASSEEN